MAEINSNHRSPVTTRALEILNIKPLTALQSLYEAGQYDKIIDLLKDRLRDRTRQWFLNPHENKDNMKIIHEAYQYLSKQFVDDVAQNTVANKGISTLLSVEAINLKFSQGELWSSLYIKSDKIHDGEAVITEENTSQETREGLKDMENKISVLKSMDPNLNVNDVLPTCFKMDEMLTMQIIPKKKLSKSASESRLKIVKFDFNEVKKANTKKGWDLAKDASPKAKKPLSKSASEATLRITHLDVNEGVTFVKVTRGSAKAIGSRDTRKSSSKSSLESTPETISSTRRLSTSGTSRRPSTSGTSRRPSTSGASRRASVKGGADEMQQLAIPKKPFSKSNSESKLKLPKNLVIPDEKKMGKKRGRIQSVHELEVPKSGLFQKKTLTKSVSELRLRIPKKESQEEIPEVLNETYITNDVLTTVKKGEDNDGNPSKKPFSKSASESRLKIPKTSILMKFENDDDFIKEEEKHDIDNSNVPTIIKVPIKLKTLKKSASESRLKVHNKDLSTSFIKNSLDEETLELKKTPKKRSSGSSSSRTKSKSGEGQKNIPKATTVGQDNSDSNSSWEEENLKFDLSAELSRRLYVQGLPSQTATLRMARALKWMGKLDQINNR